MTGKLAGPAWIQPFPPRLRGLLWMELRLHSGRQDSVAGAIVAVWVVALAVGALMVWFGKAPPGVLFWALPTFFGAATLGARLGGAERRLGVEEFTLALPVDRSLRFWSRFVLASGAWVVLSAGTWLLLYGPLWLSGEGLDGPHLLNTNQSAWVLGPSWIVLALTFALFADWRPQAHFERLFRQWPWLFFAATLMGSTEVEIAKNWPIWPVFFLLVLGGAIATRGSARYTRRPLSQDRVAAPGAPWISRCLRPLLFGPRHRRGLIWGELRTLDNSWGFLGLSILVGTCVLGVLHEGISSAYLPWIILATCLLSATSVAIVMAGYRTNLGIDEFVAGLPPRRRDRFRVRFAIGLVLAAVTILLIVGFLRSGLLVWILGWLPETVRRTALGAEALPPMVNAETAFVALPLLLFGYSAAFMAAARHHQFCQEAADAEGSNYGFVLPGLALVATRFLAAASGVLWLGYLLFDILLLVLAGRCYRRAETRALTIDLPEPSGSASNKGTNIFITLSAMSIVLLGFAFLFGVGEAERLGRYYAAGNLSADDYLERVLPGRLISRRADCYALAKDPDDCRDSVLRGNVRRGHDDREIYKQRLETFKAARAIDPRLARHATDFASSPYELEGFVQRLEVALADPTVAIEDRGWFARSPWSLDEFKARKAEIVARLPVLWGGSQP